ncbi:MAG TPA: T9SS type A sorting domain-containing protein [Flavobacteriaceae bacterium]|nr:T9SS type A sorting domain-containing protein [Flavobacteriaceae bacterium]
MRKNYFKNILVAVLMMFTLNIFAQGGRSFWTESSKENASRKELNFRKTEPTKAQFYNLNIEALKTYLADAPNRKNGVSASEKLVSFPTSDNTFETYSVMEASIMEETLQQKYSNIRTYVGKSIDNPTNTMRLSITPQGLHTMSFVSGKGLEFIDPYTKDAGQYIVYAKKDLPKLDTTWTCDFEDDEVSVEGKSSSVNTMFNANDGMMREFRLALACTIEYAQFHWTAAGLTIIDSEAAKKAAVLAAMVVTINRNNFVYERDLSVTMTLVANNESIIFINSDSFTNDNAGALINESQTVIDANIGFSNYDIGHTFSTGGGGLAQLNSPCTTSKARGITGSPAPVGDPYDIDYVAHEMGHQYGAPHTFNGDSGSCAGNRSATNAYEPGSGSTIMGYAGICAPQNVQSNSDAYFHQKSLQMMWANITTGNSTCASQTPTGNSAPTADAGANYTIPISTPFKLTGSSTDADGTSTHTYTWEQYDLGPAGLPAETNTTGPLVRSFEGTDNPTRYIPRMEDILLNGGVSTTWEKLASVGRTESFRLTVRDNDVNGGQTAQDFMVATVSASDGPFLVTSQNTNQIVWTQGTTETITWDVAGTATAPGVNTPNVNILLSTDGGQNFDTILASNVPNNGSYDITVPNITAPYCRIMVEGAGNIFFNINDYFFAIGDYTYSTVDVCEDYTFNAGIPVPESTTSYTGYLLTVPDDLLITDVNIAVDISHNDNSDLYYAYRYPNYTGTGVEPLASGICAGSTNAVFVFDDEGTAVNCASTANGDNILPQAPLSNADGNSSQGDWVFYITDVAVGDGNTATWNSVTLSICSSTIQPVLSTEDFDFESSFSLYPNPNNGQFTIKFNNAKDVKLEVYDVRGRSVLSQEYNVSGQFNETINLGNVQSGMYLLKVNNGGKTITKKVVVE